MNHANFACHQQFLLKGLKSQQWSGCCMREHMIASPNVPYFDTPITGTTEKYVVVALVGLNASNLFQMPFVLMDDLAVSDISLADRAII